MFLQNVISSIYGVMFYFGNNKIEKINFCIHVRITLELSINNSYLHRIVKFSDN